MRFQLSGVANLVSLPKEFTMENTEILNYISLRDKKLSIFPNGIIIVCVFKIT
jgi:hypothetical protein